jgi:phage baseplate assembly protein W
MAALTRADVLTGTVKQPEYFSDFLDSFMKTPFGNQLGRVINDDSVKQSLKNIISTNLGERMFQPAIGSNVNKLLFEPLSVSEFRGGVGVTTLEFMIKNAIEKNEPRIILIDVIVKTAVSNRDISSTLSRAGIPDENSVLITIAYRLINKVDIINFNYVLKRVR